MGLVASEVGLDIGLAFGAVVGMVLVTDGSFVGSCGISEASYQKRIVMTRRRGHRPFAEPMRLYFPYARTDLS